AQIFSQIEQLNKDYRRRNEDTTNTPNIFKQFAADVEIEFCLASRDPQDNPTTGITRHNLGQPAYTDGEVDQNVKPQTQWDPTKYLNIWTVRFGGNQTDLLGYSSVPGNTNQLDGVVIGFRFFGTVGNLQAPYNK